MARIKDYKDIFDHYYKYNSWGNYESVSGPGSTLKYTENLRMCLPDIVHQYNIASVLDAPCGDYNWMRHVKWNKEINYTGGDIVGDMIIQNREKYGATNVRFTDLDIINDSLPQSDLWICRDCWIHFSDKDTHLAIKNFLDSEIEYLLATNYPDTNLNTDINTGEFRMINLRCEPFNFTEPLVEIDDWIHGYPKRTMALWHRAQIIKSSLNSSI